MCRPGGSVLVAAIPDARKRRQALADAWNRASAPGKLALALSLAVGLGVSQQPLILQFAPDWLKTLLSSGIAAGGITAIVLNLVFPQEK